jgi:hypothetical protein
MEVWDGGRGHRLLGGGRGHRLWGGDRTQPSGRIQMHARERDPRERPTREVRS